MIAITISVCKLLDIKAYLLNWKSKRIAKINKLKTNGADPSDIQKYKAEELLDIQEQMKSNGFWLSGLSNAYLNEKEPAKILEGEKMLELISVKSTKKTAKKYLSGKNVIKVVLLPEEWPLSVLRCRASALDNAQHDKLIYVLNKVKSV